MYNKQYVNVCEHCNRIQPTSSLDENQEKCLDNVACEVAYELKLNTCARDLQEKINFFVLRYHKTLKNLQNDMGENE